MVTNTVTVAHDAYTVETAQWLKQIKRKNCAC